MSEIIQRIKKIGGSLMVRIPKEIVDIEHIKAGEAVRVEIQKIKKDMFGAFPKLKPFNKKTDRMHLRYE